MALISPNKWHSRSAYSDHQTFPRRFHNIECDPFLLVHFHDPSDLGEQPVDQTEITSGDPYYGYAQTIDQVQDEVTSTYSLGRTGNAQQGITAGVSGILAGFDFWSLGTCENTSSYDVDVYINLGEPWQTDANDFSGTVTIAGNGSGWSFVDTSSANIHLSEEDTFTIGFMPRSSSCAFVLRTGIANPYREGKFYFRGSEAPGIDIAFRTYMMADSKQIDRSACRRKTSRLSKSG